MTQPFVDVNAQRLTRLQRQHPNLTRIHPGVVRRSHAEPEPAPPPQTALDQLLEERPAQSERPEPVAGKKKRTRAKVDENTRAVAVSRVEKLVQAGNAVSKATASVAKELGVSESSITNWRTAAKKAPKPPKATRAAKKTRANGAPPAESNGAQQELATTVLAAFAAWLDHGVREVVRQEIRRMLA